MIGRGEEAWVRAFCLAVFFVLLGLRVFAYATADGAEPPYLGSWKVATAAVAPWVAPQRAPDAAQRARLIGKTVVFEATAIAGPSPFTCRGPRYKFRDFTPAMLFQGAFDEMKLKDKAVDPDRLAGALGFIGPSIKTLETGCDFDFYFVDASTAQVGFNDFVYTLKKQ
jgi:hypothetical protein